ncbi:MAG: glycoside hydrolase family 16 protein [Oscillibacter sp.]|nr:glycoside hydrolase family 16 protein [Oscillibacter sp.]
MGLFSKNKKIRSTYEAETLRKAFDEDYETYNRVGSSEDLKRYNELDAYVNSPVFKDRRKKIEQLSYKDSEYYTAEKKYKKLLKFSKLKSYYIIRESQELKGYLKIRESSAYAEFAKLHVIVNAAGFDKKLRPEEYLAYRKLLKDPRIKASLRFEKNRKYRDYTEMSQSQVPQEFEQLSAYIKSDDFKKNREYLLNKKRYLTTDDYKLLCEFKDLKKRPDIVKYFSLCADPNFRNMCKWELVVHDDFNQGKLDAHRWITRYYAGERFLDDTYAVGQDVQLFTADNIVFTNTSAVLKFKKESIIGKYWDNTLGITEKSFDYTSGLLSSAIDFRQCYGKFEAKIKLSRSAVKQCFWMRGDTDMPHIQIVENGPEGVKMGTICGSGHKCTSTIQPLKDMKLANDYYIFTLEWTREKLVWKINDMVVKEIRDNIPDIPMYVIFSLGANEVPADRSLPATMEIDWVRFYKMKN